MHRKTSTYPISLLIKDALDRSGQTPGRFVDALGYRNINGGLRALDQWLQTGEGRESLLTRLIETCGLDPNIIAHARRETAARKSVETEARVRMQDEEEARAFRPYVYVETVNSIPTQVTFNAMTGGRFKYFALPDGLTVDPASLSAVGKLIRQRHAEYEGQCPFFGPVKGYRYVPNLKESMLFDTQGIFERSEPGRFRRPYPGYVTLK